MTNPTTEPTQSIRERLARACFQAGGFGSKKTLLWDDCEKSTQDHWYCYADAILSELMEPSEGMLDAFREAYFQYGDAESCIKAMIQHIRDGGQ